MRIILKNFKKVKINNYPHIISDLLNLRGIYEEREAEYFLNPQLKFLTNPENIKELLEIKDAIQTIKDKGESITIYGDYDVDGITGSAILSHLFDLLEIPNIVYIPDRFDEGYGISREGIEAIYKQGVKNIISVDCGISSIEQVEYAKSLGMNIIITDHHHPGKNLPDTLIFNPKLQDKNTKFYDLAGCGIALYIFRLFHKKVDYLFKKMFAYAAIGTIADIVPLRNDNRVIVKLGLNALNNIDIDWINEIKKITFLEDKKLESFHIGFVIGPRLNASGRMDHAKHAYQLVMGQNIKDNAKLLDKFNTSRRKLQSDIFERCKKKINKEEPSILLYSTDFNRGVNGIVASKCVEYYNKPAIIFEDVNGILHGSGRSLKDINLIFIIDRLRKYFISAGGHEMACGITMEKNKFENFKNEFNKILVENYSNILKTKILKADLVIELHQFTEEIFQYLKKMAPFGVGNEKPIFYIKHVNIRTNPILLKEKYKKYYAEQNGIKFSILDWQGVTEFRKNDTVNLAGYLSINEYNYVKSIVLEYKGYQD